MRTIQLNQSEVLLELEPDEEFDQKTLLSAMSMACATNSLWNLYLVLLPETANLNRNWLESHGFVVAGFESKGNPNQTFIKLVKRLRTSGEAGGSTLAVAEPTLPPSAHEVAAVQEMVRRYGPRSGAA